MSQAKSYTIDKVGWHTKTPGNIEPLEKTHARFKAVIDFLQDNGLTTRPILRKDDSVDDETSIHTDALTEEGRRIIEKCYHKWLKKVDKGLDAQDTSMFYQEMNSSSKGAPGSDLVFGFPGCDRGAIPGSGERPA